MKFPIMLPTNLLTMSLSSANDGSVPELTDFQVFGKSNFKLYQSRGIIGPVMTSGVGLGFFSSGLAC